MSGAVLVLAPHQDDEILMCAGVLSAAAARGDATHVCVLTNGEYCADADAGIRSEETVAAMTSIGVPAENIHFLGFADTGMKYAISFLWRLWHAPDDEVIPSRWNRTETWNPRGDYAMQRRGSHSPYTRAGFLRDLCDMIKEVLPDEIFVTASCDLHGDHAAAGLFAREAVKQVRAAHPDWQPKLYEYLVHTEDEFAWPNRSGGTFHCPDDIKALGLDWSHRECRPLPPGFAAEKRPLIESYVSQCPEKYENYLLSFSKDEEIFWKVTL